jgi:hypothetical protein
MAKISNVLPDDWLAGYVRNQVLDTLAPSERMQFRMACGRGSEALQEWANATLPKYTAIWRRLKSAERQRRYRSVPSTEKWMTDWRAAERTLGKNLTTILRRNRATLGQSASATPADVLTAALNSLDESLTAQPARVSTARTDEAAHGPLGADSTRAIPIELRPRTRNARPREDS